MSNQDFVSYVARWIKEQAVLLAIANGLFGWACVIYILRYGR